MADGVCYGNDVVELEAMRSDSFSWHPCQISLCYEGSGLIVIYGDNNFQETINDKQEIFKRIRVRSLPLQGDDCSSIKQGERVLATSNSHVKGVFYDACVEKAIRVRHSKRIHCRCSFRIKWLHQSNDEEASTVPSSSIMKLATKSIELHPTISTFFGMMESLNDLDATQCPVVADGMNSEMDINVILEKQIKEISHSTDISRGMISTDSVFWQEVDVKGHSHAAPTIDSSLKDPQTTFPFLRKLNGFYGSENKHATETTVEFPQVCIPSIEVEFKGSGYLSPLAARAALASLRSEFPKSPSECCSFSAVDRSSYAEDSSLNISATSEGKSPDFQNIVKKLFPTSNAPHTVYVSNLSSGAQIDEMDKEKKITQQSHSRFTRARAQKVNGKNEVTQMSNSNETQLQVTRARRVDQSSIEGVEKIDVKDNVHSKCTNLGTSSKFSIVSQNCLSNKQKLQTSLIDGETSEGSDKDESNLLGRDGIFITDNLQKVSFIQNAEKQRYPKRQTRSAAQVGSEKNNVQPDVQTGTLIQKRVTRSVAQEKTEINNLKSKGKPRKSSSLESIEVEDVEWELDSSLSSPRAAKGSKQITEERENKKLCTRVKSTPKCSVGNTRQKSWNSKMQASEVSLQPASRRQTLPQSKLDLET